MFIADFAVGEIKASGNILATLIDDADFEWLMIDASYVTVHPYAAGAKGGNQAMGRTKWSLIRKFI